MRTILLCTSFILLQLYVCSQPETKLAEAFLQSLQNKNFALLKPYLGKNAKMIETKWKQVAANITKAAFDIKHVKIDRVELSDPIPNMPVRMLVATYKYHEKEWDDLSLMVNTGTVKSLIDIPNTSYMFMQNEDRRGRNLNEILLQRDKENPAIQKSVQAAIIELQATAAKQQPELIAANLVYRGADEQRKWKSSLKTSEKEEMEYANNTIKRINDKILKCKGLTFDKLRIERESEGIWYALKVYCDGNSVGHFAFLKINGNFLLGDIDND